MRVSTLLVCFAGLAAGAAGFSQQEPERLRYFKREQLLRRDPEVFVFKAAARRGSFDRALEILKARGVAVGRVRRVGATEWFVAPTPRRATEPGRADAFLDALATYRDFAFVAPQWKDEHGGAVVVGPPLYVGFEPSALGGAGRVLAEEGAGIVVEREASGVPGVFALAPPVRTGVDLLALADRLARRGDVRFAEPEIVAYGRPLHVPSDPEYRRAWALQPGDPHASKVAVGAPDAWAITRGDPEIPILLLDDGVEDRHPDVRAAARFDATARGGRGLPHGPLDRHGTAVAGVLVADMDNGVGACGIAPGCSLLSAKVYSADARRAYVFETAALPRALMWGRSLGARVSNFSVHLSVRSAFAAAAYERAHELGMTHVAAAGNRRSEATTFPVDLPFVRSVVALDADGRLARFSSYGSRVDFAAPGENVFTSDLRGVAGFSRGDFAVVSGTSFAAPMVAATAALVLSVDRTLSVALVEDVLRRGVSDLGDKGRDPIYGYGAVHAGRSVAAAFEEAKNRKARPTLASVSASGLQGDGDCDAAVVSGDGAWIVFESDATNLAPRDRNRTADVFAAPTIEGRLVRLSIASDGLGRVGASREASPSFDGRFVAFTSFAPFDADDRNGVRDVYVRDRDADDDGHYDEVSPSAQRTTLVSRSAAGSGDGPSFSPALSADGRVLVFASRARNLAVPNPEGTTSLYVATRDRDDFAVVARLDLEVGGEPSRVVVSPDGRRFGCATETFAASGEKVFSTVVFVADDDGVFRSRGEVVDARREDVDVVLAKIAEESTGAAVPGFDGSNAARRRGRRSTSADGKVVAWTAVDDPADFRDVNRRRDVFYFRVD